MESAINALDSPPVAAPPVLVDARFKAISSLKEIIVNVCDEPISCDLREEMRGADGQSKAHGKNRRALDLMIRRTTTGGMTITMRM